MFFKTKKLFTKINQTYTKKKNNQSMLNQPQFFRPSEIYKKKCLKTPPLLSNGLWFIAEEKHVNSLQCLHIDSTHGHFKIFKIAYILSFQCMKPASTGSGECNFLVCHSPMASPKLAMHTSCKSAELKAVHYGNHQVYMSSTLGHDKTVCARKRVTLILPLIL